MVATRQSPEVTKALRLIEGGMTPYAAAKKVGIALSTIYRAISRRDGEGAALRAFNRHCGMLRAMELLRAGTPIDKLAEDLLTAYDFADETMLGVIREAVQRCLSERAK